MYRHKKCFPCYYSKILGDGKVLYKDLKSAEKCHLETPIGSFLTDRISNFVDQCYLCYKEPKSPYNVVLIYCIRNCLRLKLRMNGNIERREARLWTERKSNCCLRSHTNSFTFPTVLPRL